MSVTAIRGADRIGSDGSVARWAMDTERGGHGKVSTTSVDVTTSIVIGRPRGQVSAFAGDLDRTASWYRNITSVNG